MKKLFYILLFLSFCGFSFQEKEVCGVNRWGVKTLTDSLASKVRMKPIKTTIDSLRSIKPDRKIGGKVPRFGTEFYTFKITCGIKEFSKEEDGDIHLILYDLKDTNKYFVAEIPDPNCPMVKGSKYVAKFQKCREEVEKWKLPKGKMAKGEYVLTGVFFFDRLHNVSGAAPNGGELHPLLTIKKTK